MQVRKPLEVHAMESEEQPESSWEEPERLGPYHLHEQVPQGEHGQGELYRAIHEVSGATALMLKPSAESEQDSAQSGDWRVRCVSSAAPRYLAMEVEHTPWSFAPGRHSVEELLLAFEAMQEGMALVAQHLAPSEPRPQRRRLGLVMASFAAGCALVFAVLHMAPVPPPTGEAGSPLPATTALSSGEGPAGTDMPLTGHSLMGLEDGGSLALAHPFPKKPYKGQKRPPCTPRVEVEIMGACWVPHKLKAPCPEELYEYQGECYTTAMKAQPPPQAFAQ